MAMKVLRKGKTTKTNGSNGKAKKLDSVNVVDYPREGEKISSRHYAIRISGHPGDKVQLSFDSKVWHSCRFSVGYYWFDWLPSKPGKYSIAIRGGKAKGRLKKSPIRSFSVVGLSPN